jgi:hypothetical protein
VEVRRQQQIWRETGEANTIDPWPDRTLSKRSRINEAQAWDNNEKIDAMGAWSRKRKGISPA